MESKDYKIATATILIPTGSSPEDSTGNEIDVQNQDTFQIVDIRAIKCTNNFAVAYIYEGNSDQLNAEARDIIDGIQLVCTDE